MSAPSRILIYRMGSLGDTVVALPVFHMLKRVFPDAERRVLTNFPVNSDAAPLRAVLGDEFADGFIAYPRAMRKPGPILKLRREIRAWGPDLVVYLNEPRKLHNQYRDLFFLRWCGAREIVGMPFSSDMRRHRGPDANGMWESEGARLARCVAALGDARRDDPASHDLCLTGEENAAADAAFKDWAGRGRFIAFGIGAKIDFKSWGDDRWQRVLGALTDAHPDLGLVLIGGPGDSARAMAVAGDWRGPVLDLCGKVSPRVSAAVIREAVFYTGHDSGPMHLAASVGTPAVIVFSTHAKPGVWFPFGARYRIFYPGLAWSGGEPPVMRDAAGETNILLIRPDQVLEACRSMLADAAEDKVR
jgi:heptosyltransferase-3